MHASHLLHRRFWVLALAAVLAGSAAAQSPTPQQLVASADSALRDLQTALAAIPVDSGRGKKNDRAEFAQDSASIQRNLQQAVPGLLGDVRGAPENLANTFKLYRDIEAVYQVALRALEAASRFSSRQQVDNLSAAVENLRNQEDQVATYIQRAAAAQLAEIQRLRGSDMAKAPAAPATAAGAKTMVIDADAPPAPEKPKRKRPRKKGADATDQKTSQPQ